MEPEKCQHCISKYESIRHGHVISDIVTHAHRKSRRIESTYRRTLHTHPTPLARPPAAFGHTRSISAALGPPARTANAPSAARRV